MERKSFERYIDDIIDKNPLTLEEEKELSLRIMNGDRKAADKLVTSNLKFVISIARQYQNQGVDFDDLVSEGNIALLQAAYKYDARKSEGRFVGYALPFIRRNIEECLSKNTVMFSVDAPLGGRDNVNLLNVLPNEDSPAADSLINHNSISDRLSNAIGYLNERERSVIQMLYGIDCDKLTMVEAANALGLKRERVRQIRDKALRIIKKHNK